MRVLLLDAYNLLHRARFGYDCGEHRVTFNFFRGLKPFADKFKPERIYLVMEGSARRNRELLPEYKANRAPSADNFRQQLVQVRHLVGMMPIRVVRHPDLECDDTLFNIAVNWHKEDEVTVVSTDSDFIQLYDVHQGITLYHPVNKEEVPPYPGEDYVLWKALRGDKTDNVPGITGIGDKTADKLAHDPELLAKRMADPEFKAQFDRNYQLIKLEDLGVDRMSEIEMSMGPVNWDKLREDLQALEFRKMTEDRAWSKFVASFQGVS